MAQIQYTPYVNQIQTQSKPIESYNFDTPIVKSVQKSKEEISLAPLPELKASVPEVTPTIVKGIISNPKKYNIGNMQDALDGLANAGISFRITSGIRPGAMTKSGHRSHHADGNAVDIIVENADWEAARKKVKASKELQELFRSRGWGILDETTPDVMSKTGATGAHWHIGPDKWARQMFETMIARHGMKLQDGNKIEYTPYVNLDPTLNKQPETNIQFYTPSIRQPMVLLKNEPPKGYQPQYNLAPLPEVKQSITHETQTEINPIPGINMDNLNTINVQLKNAGFGKIQRAAILATICQESHANPEAIGDNGRARGLFQWHGSRFNAGNDLNSQIQLVINGLRDFKDVNGWLNNKKWNRKESFDRFNGDDLQDAVTAITYSFIRPSNQEQRSKERFNIAQEIYNQLN